MRRSRLLIVSLAFMLSGVAFTAPSFAAPSTSGTPVVIGLGDSFTSGVGTSALDAKSSICRRSTNSYPLEAARTLGVVGSNAACSGATVSALSGSFRGQLPQISKVGEAKFVVMTMGGNDVISPTAAAKLTIDETALAADLATTETQLVSNLAALKSAAPDATVLLLAYPDLFPTDAATATCPAAVTTALPKLHTAFASLNTTLKSAADKAKITFLDTSKAFSGHDVCSADPWVTGLDSPTDALHPNDKGHAALAKATADAIRPLLTKTSSDLTATGVKTANQDAPGAMGATPTMSDTPMATEMPATPAGDMPAAPTTPAADTPSGSSGVAGAEIPIIQITPNASGGTATGTVTGSETAAPATSGNGSDAAVLETPKKEKPKADKPKVEKPKKDEKPTVSPVVVESPVAKNVMPESATSVPTTTAVPKVTEPVTAPTTDTAAAPVVEEPTTTTPQLARTGAQTQISLAIGSTLMAIGLAIFWLQMTIERRKSWMY